MDQFAEQLVKKYHSTSDDVKRTCIVVVTILVCAVSVLLICMGFTLALILPVCAVWAAVYLLKLQHVEYEYSCTNGSLDIDKIMGQNKRRSMLSVDVSSFTVYGKVGIVPESDAEMTTFSVMGVSLMGTEEESEEYYAEFEHPDYGKCCLYFSPDSRLREALEPFLSRELKRQLNQQKRG